MRDIDSYSNGVVEERRGHGAILPVDAKTRLSESLKRSGFNRYDRYHWQEIDRIVDREIERMSDEVEIH